MWSGWRFFLYPFEEISSAFDFILELSLSSGARLWCSKRRLVVVLVTVNILEVGLCDQIDHRRRVRKFHAILLVQCNDPVTAVFVSVLCLSRTRSLRPASSSFAMAASPGATSEPTPLTRLDHLKSLSFREVSTIRFTASPNMPP